MVALTRSFSSWPALRTLVQSNFPAWQRATTPRLTKYIAEEPTLRQAIFLLLTCREAMYGGAAGGGKSSALLAGSLQYADVPGYSALLLRRSYTDLALPGAIMDRSHHWLRGTDAHWSEREKTWTFPGEATLSFGYLASDNDVYRYQSAEFQYIGFDELTQFSRFQYTYLFSRLRRKAGVEVPLRMRAASNPGGEGHEWVYDRFMPDLTPEAITHRQRTGRIFVPALLEDNPHIDREAYLQSLSELDPITRKQLEEGIWVTDPAARPFSRDWWRGKNRFWRESFDDMALLNSVVGRWQSWDTATGENQHNAYSAMVEAGLTRDYRLMLTNCWKDKLMVPFLATAVRDQAMVGNRDGRLEEGVIEDKSSGTGVVQTLRLGTDWLAERLVAFSPNNYGDKVRRAQQAALWCKRGCVLLPEPSAADPWLFDFEKQLFLFPNTEYKDMVDAFSQLVIYLEHYLAEGWRARGCPE